jgi:Ca-activated chloride channel family protein
LTRLEGVKKVFRVFVEGGAGPEGERLEARPHDLISLTVFAKRPETVCPLTLDHATVLKVLDEQQARTIPGESDTNPGDAVAWALAGLSKAPTRRKVLILLTDGESNVKPPALTPRQAAQLAGNLGIPIYTIDAGNELAAAADAAGGEPPVADKGQDRAPSSSPSKSKPQQSLQEVARISQGRYFQANNGDGLLEACAAIDRLERDRILGFQFRRWHEGYVWFALVALAAWFTVLTLESTLWRRVP